MDNNGQKLYITTEDIEHTIESATYTQPPFFYTTLTPTIATNTIDITSYSYNDMMNTYNTQEARIDALEKRLRELLDLANSKIPKKDEQKWKEI